uniref:Membrane insertase YidC/Oxa/ALB C-terminal domain-containing protein n=1 Tax=Davidia involucrata TaxID=16924 RepID=A0A5B7A9C5_DAVIN
MAYRRSISTRATLLARQRFSPSFSYIHHEDDRKHRSVGEDHKINNFIQNRSFGGSFTTSSGFGAVFQEQRCSQFFVPPMIGSIFSRHMSTTIGDEANKIGYMTDVAEVLADKTVEVVASQAPVVNEVAIAAADSFFNVAALQYLIDGVHSFTGFNWWASIVVTTLLIRGATIPLLINQLKATTKLTLMRPHLEEIKQEMQDKGMDPNSVADGQKRMKELFKEYGVNPLTPMKGLLIQGPVFISFFLAITNMVEKVPSFKSGGAFWFTDLTTPDTFYIFPILAGLTFWITVECNAQEGLEGNPIAGTMKKVSRVFAALTVPITMSFPKAIFCYWVTSNLFSLMYGLVIRRPGVKKFLGVPIIPVAPPTSPPKPGLSFIESVKQYSAAMQRATQQPASSPVEVPKLTDHRISSSSVNSQRLRRLEKEVKGRKKNKKR